MNANITFRTSAACYLILTLSWSWLFWNASLWLNSSSDPSTSPLFLIGGAGPFLIAVFLTHWREAVSVQRSFWTRIFDPRPIGGVWWLAALFLHPIIIALAFVTNSIVSGDLPEFRLSMQSISAISSLIFFTFWFGPLPEEIGWRGFALDRIQTTMSPLKASLFLGTVWALWHVPLFWISGTFQHTLGFGSLRSWIFLVSMVPLSVLITWVYNNTNRSTLSAILVHFSGNLCGTIFIKTERIALFEVFYLIIAAGIVTKIQRGRTWRLSESA